MARNFNGGNYLSTANGVVTAAPLTMACWAKSSTAGSLTAMSIANSATADDYFRLFWDDPNTVYAQARSASALDNSSLASVVKDGTWRHLAAVYASSASRTVYADGIAGTTNTTACTPGGLNTTGVGVLARVFNDVPFNGDIAEAAIWNAALTTAEVASLAKAVDPRRIRPGNLVAYWPLMGRNSPEPDLVGGYAMTLNSAPAYAAHPRMVRRWPSVWTPTAAAAPGGGFQAAWAKNRNTVLVGGRLQS